MGRGGRGRQRGLDAGVSPGGTLWTAQVPGQEAQVVQRKHLEERKMMDGWINIWINGLIYVLMDGWINIWID